MKRSVAQDEELLKKAQKQVEDKVGFYIHFAAYLGVNAMFVLFWWITTPMAFPWFVIPMVGWGIGIVIHFVVAFMGQGYIERATQREYARMRGGTP